MGFPNAIPPEAMTKSQSLNQPFEVEIPESDLTFTVPSDQSIVQVAALHGIEILTGCENGQCGTCLVKVLEGNIDHRDRALTDEKKAEGWMCACVSRAQGPRIVVEIW